MKADRQTYELIERYLKDELGEQERISVEGRIKTDKGFSDLVYAQKVANDIIIGNRLMQVKRMMDADFNKGKVKGTTTKKWWFGGGILMLAIISTLWYTQDNQPIAKPNREDRNTKKETGIQTYPEEQNKENGKSIAKRNTNSQEKSVLKNTSPLQKVIVDSVKKDSIVEPVKIGLEKTSPVQSFTNTEERKEFLLPPASACIGIKIEAEISQEPACTGKSNGVIHILDNTLKGGHSPYHFMLVRPDKDTLRQTEEQFVNLPSGAYTLIIQDKNKCISTPKLIYLLQQNCTKSKVHSFNPSLGEVFNYPISKDQEATITIVDRNGRKVRQDYIHAGYPESWNGTDQNGQNVPPALYIYIMEDKSGHKETGEIILY